MSIYHDGEGHARTGDPETSREAAHAVPATRLEHLVLNVLQASPAGATSYQVAERLKLNIVTVSPRIQPLVKKGFIRDSGRKMRGVSGRNQIVWEAVERS